MDSQILQIAMVVNNLISCVMATIFLLCMLPKMQGLKKQASLWLMAFFLLFSSGFVTSISRDWLPIEWVVLANNALLQLACYCLLFVSMAWFHVKVTKGVMAIALLHTSLYSALQYALLHSGTDTLLLRSQIAMVSYQAILIFNLVFWFHHRDKYKTGEQIYAGCLVLAMLAICIPMVILTVTQQHAYFHVSIFWVQNAITLLLFAGMLALFFYDEIDWHYQRATRDELTGLYNRRYFTEQAPNYGDPRLLRKILVIDVDHFKKVNDSYGHDVGDLVLEYIGKEVTQHFGDFSLCARYGGEEFVVLCQPSPLHNLDLIIEQFMANIQTTKFEHDQGRLMVTVSVGIATWAPGQALYQAFKQADKALYSSKKRGRNTVTDYQDALEA